MPWWNPFDRNRASTLQKIIDGELPIKNVRDPHQVGAFLSGALATKGALLTLAYEQELRVYVPTAATQRSVRAYLKDAAPAVNSKVLLAVPYEGTQPEVALRRFESVIREYGGRVAVDATLTTNALIAVPSESEKVLLEALLSSFTPNVSFDFQIERPGRPLASTFLSRPD